MPIHQRHKHPNTACCPASSHLSARAAWPRRMSVLLRTVALLISVSYVVGRPMQSTDAGAATPSRTLQQSPSCPDGCMAGACVQDSTAGGLRCQECAEDLLVDTATGECSCPLGRYAVNGTQTCIDCPKGSWCPGGPFRPSAQPPVLPAAVPCPQDMTTLGMRSTTDNACVNLPGFYYTLVDDQPGAVECGIDEYSPGLKKQRACVPCPTGFGTNFKVQQTRPTACIVPPGYYLKSPGQVAPCPQGEWKADIGASANCTKCAAGGITPQVASTSEAECKVLLPGFVALEMSPEGAITKTLPCPQKFWCPGGTPGSVFDPNAPGTLSPAEGSIKLCPNGTFTAVVGATNIAQCRTPPGFFTADGTTQPCPDGSYRAGWSASAPSCEPCGEGVKAAKTDFISIFSLVNNTESFLPVTTSSQDCYIQPGQGLYYQLTTQTYRARNCDINSYGVASITYGLTPFPCRDCPLGQIASSNSSQFPNSASHFVRNADGTGGFVSVSACVNLPGYGYNGRVSQPCPTGTYSPGDNYATCISCPLGFTTAGIGAGVTEADCGVAAGWGNVNSTIRPCPIGTFNPVRWSLDTNVTCAPCPTFTTTAQEGSVLPDSCNLCVPGGGGDACLTQCGGVGPLASYGPPGRTVGTPCLPCSTSKTGFSFEWQAQNDLFQANAISRAGATRPCDCLSEFQQMVDGAWYIRTSDMPNPAAANATTNTSANSFKECVAQCTGPQCLWVTYNYNTKHCYTRNSPVPLTFAGAPFVGLKAMPSGDLGITPGQSGDSSTTTPKLHEGRPHNCTIIVTAKAITSGQYSFYRDPAAAEILGTEPAPGRDGFLEDQDCLTACDFDGGCAGVILLDTLLLSDRPKTCSLIKGDPTLGVFLRTVTRTDVTRLARGSIPV